MDLVLEDGRITMPDIVCLKCGYKVDVKAMQHKHSFACPACLEPLPDLQELERCDWAEGDQNEGI